MERIIDISNFDNLKNVLIHFLVIHGDIPLENITNKLVSFVANGINVFFKMWNSLI
jgi:hypothetical protein